MVVKTGAYKVSESGSNYQFGAQEQDFIGSPEQIIANFRYVLLCVAMHVCFAVVFL